MILLYPNRNTGIEDAISYAENLSAQKSEEDSPLSSWTLSEIYLYALANELKRLRFEILKNFSLDLIDITMKDS